MNNIYERHFQTVIQIIIIGILLWFGNKTIATSDAVIRLEEQVLAIRASINTATTNRFDVDAMKQIIDYKIDSLNRRVSVLEGD